MKKKILILGTLVTSMTAYAITDKLSPVPTNTDPAKPQPVPQIQPMAPTPPPTTTPDPSPAPTSATTPGAPSSPATPASPPTTPQATTVPHAEPPAMATQPTAIGPTTVITCDYKVPPTTKTVAPEVILSWAKNASKLSFQFNAASIDAELKSLQICFTPQGWEGFSEALQKSGNLDAIKKHGLKVTSEIDGEAVITETKGNFWKVSLPLRVIYRNDKENLTQLLSVNLLIGRKSGGDFGIVQLIAIPRTASTTETPTNPAAPPANPTPLPSPGPGPGMPSTTTPPSGSPSPNPGHS